MVLRAALSAELKPPSSNSSLSCFKSLNSDAKSCFSLAMTSWSPRLALSPVTSAACFARLMTVAKLFNMNLKSSTTGFTAPATT